MSKIKLLLFSFIFIVIAAVGYYSYQELINNKVDFNTEIRPIINKNCITCHGGVKRAGGFSLLFRSDALEKAESGKPAIIPGDADASEFIKRLHHHDKELRMPLGKPALSDKEITLLKKWINQGANWEDHWSFVKPKAVTPPSVDNKDFVKNDIDKFVLAKLNEVELKPSAMTDKATLIRRVSLDLTGLPPTLPEIDAFVNDKSENAYEKVVDRLLASPRYGERWTAVWLDLARYADSKGYEKDLARNIWRYRDYLIKSFNKDKPYDQFTIEQLAGDLLPNPTDEQILATAFHRNTMNNDEGGTDDEEFRTAAIIDRVNTTFDVWQGITIGCVQCHSHPYDPIRHNEYYKFMAFLNNTEDADVPDDRPLHITPEDYDIKKTEVLIHNIKALTKDNNKVDLKDFKSLRRNYLFPVLQAKDYDEVKDVVQESVSMKYLHEGSYIMYKNIDLNNVDFVDALFFSEKGSVVEMRMDKADGPLLASLPIRITFGEFYNGSDKLKKKVSGKHDLYFVMRNNDKGTCDGKLVSFTLKLKRDPKNDMRDTKLDSLRIELNKSIDPTGTPVFKELPAEKSRITQVFTRGNWMAKADTVNRDVPKSLNPFPNNAPRNRLGMAQWLVNPENPLTARVAVNRFWEQIFGYGIVETLEDFGTQGAKPSHPELLDWMAVKFVKDYNWSIKKLLKLMVMSGTYRQSSVVKPEHLEKDARNKYFAHAPRVRLSAEQIRDQALAVSGLLSAKMYGPSVMPHLPPGVETISIGFGPVIRLSEGEDRNRRAIYTVAKRTIPYPSSTTFDAPSREFCLVRRIRTNTPLQALVTLNDTVFTEASVALAKRMVKEGGQDLKSRIRIGYKMALAYEPDQNGLSKLLVLHQKALDYYKNNPSMAFIMTGNKEGADELAPLALVASAILNQDEFITKQ